MELQLADGFHYGRRNNKFTYEYGVHVVRVVVHDEYVLHVPHGRHAVVHHDEEVHVRQYMYEAYM